MDTTGPTRPALGLYGAMQFLNMVWSKISCVYDHILTFHQLAFNFAQAVVQLVSPFAWWMMRVKTLYVPPRTVSIDEFSPPSRITEL